MPTTAVARCEIHGESHRCLTTFPQALDEQALARAGSDHEQCRERRRKPEQVGWAW